VLVSAKRPASHEEDTRPTDGCLLHVDLLHCFDRISRRGVHLPFRGVQPGPRGVQIPRGVQSARLLILL
jgi:hypothetical protein